MLPVRVVMKGADEVETAARPQDGAVGSGKVDGAKGSMFSERF